MKGSPSPRSIACFGAHSYWRQLTTLGDNGCEDYSSSSLFSVQRSQGRDGDWVWHVKYSSLQTPLLQGGGCAFGNQSTNVGWASYVPPFSPAGQRGSHPLLLYPLFKHPHPPSCSLHDSFCIKPKAPSCRNCLFPCALHKQATQPWAVTSKMQYHQPFFRPQASSHTCG